LSALHIGLSWPLIIVNGLVGLWALGAHWQESLRGRALWAATAVAQALLFVHAMIGGILVATDSAGREVGGEHMFYGFLTLTGIVILYGYRRQLGEWMYLLYGFGGLFVMGLAIRAHYLSGWADAALGL